MDAGELKNVLFEKQPPCSACYTDRVLFWGDGDQLITSFEPERVKSVSLLPITDFIQAIDTSTYLKSMVEETIARALIANKPLVLRKQGKTWYAVTQRKEAYSDALRPLREALSIRGRDGSVTQKGVVNGPVRGLKDAFWAEAVSLKIEERQGRLWLLLQPDVWISPNKMREEATDFLRQRKIRRYNRQAFDVLSAWIEILLGGVGKGESKVVAFGGTAYPAEFQISMRSAFSKDGADHG